MLHFKSLLKFVIVILFGDPEPPVYFSMYPLKMVAQKGISTFLTCNIAAGQNNKTKQKHLQCRVITDNYIKKN